MLWPACHNRQALALNLGTQAATRPFFLKMSFIRQKTVRKTTKAQERRNRLSNASFAVINLLESITVFLLVKAVRVSSNEAFDEIFRTRAGGSKIVRWISNTEITVSTAG